MRRLALALAVTAVVSAVLASSALAAGWLPADDAP